MHTRTKVAGWSVVLVVLAIVAFTLYRHTLSLALSSECSNDILKEVKSPGEAYVATVFERNCGATTPFYRVVSLRSTDSKFDPEEQEDWILAVEHQPDIRLEWEDATHLFLPSYSDDDESVLRRAWRDVTIVDKLAR